MLFLRLGRRWVSLWSWTPVSICYLTHLWTSLSIQRICTSGWSLLVYACVILWLWTMGFTRRWRFSCVANFSLLFISRTDDLSLSVTPNAGFDGHQQRAKPATKREMTQFHSDEYVDFLSRVTPTNMNSYIKEQHKCTSRPHVTFPD